MNLLSNKKLPSERSFGFLFAAVFAALAGYGFALKGWSLQATCVALGVSAGFLILAAVAPKVLAPLNKAWFLLGELLGKIVSPVVLGVIFFVIVTPVALVGRLFGKDELRLKRRQTDSYWMVRQPPGPAPDSFKNQF